MCRRQVEAAVVAAGTPRPVLLADHVQGRRESEQRMMPAASSSRNSVSAWRSLSGPRWRALANTGRPVVLIVWRILCFGDGFLSRRRRWLGTKLTRTVPSVLWSRGRRRIWSAGSRRRFLLWTAVLEFSSPALGGRLVNQQPVGGQEI